MKNLLKLRTLCVLLIIAMLACHFQPVAAYTKSYSIDHIDIGVDLSATVFVNNQPETINFRLTKEDAKYVTIYASDSASFSLSGGVSTSTDNKGKSQIRIEGDFPIGTSSNPIYYTVCLSKNVTTSNGSTVKVTLSSTMQYWGAGNVCPGYKKTPSRMSGIDLNLADTGRGNLLIQKTISGATLDVDKTYDVEILNASGSIYKTVSITVPAGETSASVILANLDLGTYTIREVADTSEINNYNLVSTTYSNNGSVTLSSDNHTGSCNITNTYQEVHVHSYDAQIVKPTCTTDGYTVYTCICGHSYQDNTVVTPGHDYESVITPPSCTDDGFTTHTCTVCGDTYTDSTVTAAGHGYNSVVTRPTCTQDGYTTHTCLTCGDSYVDDRKAAYGHSYEGVITPPNCTEVGYTTYTCSNCGDTYIDDREVACGHSYKGVITYPTCTENGYTTYTCSKCGDSYVGDKIDAHGHNYKSNVTIPTCTEDGFTTHTCTVCGDTYTDSFLPASGHSYEGVVTHPTCTEEGYTTHTCSKCGDSYVDNRKAAYGHNYESVVTEPSCTDGGYTTHTCSRCNDSYIDGHKDALGHTGGTATCVKLAVCIRCEVPYGETNDNHAGDKIIKNTKPSVCIDVGYTGDVYCADCGDLLETGKPISANGHSMGVWIVIKAATCTEKGTEQRKCDNCEYVETREIDVVAHCYTSSVTAPTCTQNGFTTYTCSQCLDTYTDNETLSLGHDYVTTVIEPTMDEQGYSEHVCNRCEHTYKDNFTSIPVGSLEVSVTIQNAQLLKSVRLTVTVFDAENSVVAEKVPVEIQPDSNIGTFMIPKLRSGSYTVTCEVPEENTYLTIPVSEVTVFVPANEEANASFTAEVLPLTITITTVSDFGYIVPGVEVLLEYSTDNGMTWAVLTATENDFIAVGSCGSSKMSDGKIVSDKDGIATFTDLHPDAEYRATLIEVPSGYLNNKKTFYSGNGPASVICVVPLQKAALEESNEDKDIPDKTVPDENIPGEDTPNGTDPDDVTPEVITPGETLPEIMMPEEMIPGDPLPKTGDSFGNALVITILSMVVSGVAIALLALKKKRFA